MYSGTLGKVANCQIGVSVHAVTDAASVPINWALFVPESWDDTTTTDADNVAPGPPPRADRLRAQDDPSTPWIYLHDVAQADHETMTRP